jgi:hypothetical protein
MLERWLNIRVFDAEGCFSVSISIIKRSYQILFDLAQKGELDNSPLNFLKELFGVGKISAHSKPGCYSYRVNGLNDTAILFNYFDNYKLRTAPVPGDVRRALPRAELKRLGSPFLLNALQPALLLKSYILWKDLHKRLINKEHLDHTMIFTLKTLASKINNTWD